MRRLSRRERIVFLLEHYADFFVLSDRGGDQAGDGGVHVALLPLMASHPSVVELCRCLALLEGRCPSQFRHLKAWYTAEWRTVDRPVRRRSVSGKWVWDSARERERIVPSWVRMEKVRRSTDFVVGAFRGEPFVPDELLELVA